MKKILVFVFLVVLLGSCASTTKILTKPDDAKVYVNNKFIGNSPVEYTSRKVSFSSTTIEIEKEGYKKYFGILKRNEVFKPTRLLSSLFLWFPNLFYTMDYNPYHNYDLELIDKELYINPVLSNPVSKTNTISLGKADVDVNIPKNATKNLNRYALVIGNEDYSSKQTSLSNEIDVEFARNDANSFKNYLVSTLGFIEDYVTILTDATGGMINRETAKLIQLAKLDSKSEIVFYYAGHGLPDDDKNPYLLPVDVSTINLKEDGLALKELYSKLASSNAAKITVFLDACFSGGGRDQGLLAARGVKIKPKEETFTGNMVVFASSSGEERSLPYEEKQHGFFTYFLLKKLQETKGNASYGELSEYIKKEVARNSLLKKSLQQTPHTNISPRVQEKWKTWSFR